MFRLSIFLLCCLPFCTSFADQYPDMVGVWKGPIRTISSGGSADSQVAKGGALIEEVNLKVTIDHQDGETFIGKVRLSNMTKDQPSIPLWGAIRSDGKEAIYIGGNGARGPLWFLDENTYEFCTTNIADGVMTAYCGIVTKQKTTQD